MCRWLAYYGRPLPIDEPLYRTQYSLVEQSRRARARGSWPATLGHAPYRGALEESACSDSTASSSAPKRNADDAIQTQNVRITSAAKAP